jgi:choline dehydrogenase-like flavoprotein
MSAAPYPRALDAVIVGSGPVGAAFARILSELAPEASVGVFEAGPTVTEPPGAHVKNIVDESARADAQRRSEGPIDGGEHLDAADAETGRRKARPGTYLLPSGFAHPGETGLPYLAFSANVGGMGAHWTGACPTPGDSERIDFLPDLDELLEDAERLLGVSRHAFDGAPFGDHIRDRLSTVIGGSRPEHRQVQRMPLAVQGEGETIRWSGSDVVFGSQTRANPNVSLYDLSQVRRILHDEGETRGILVRDLSTGHECEISAPHVIVAADAIRTPQLLFASGIRPAALGHQLNDQPQLMLAARITDSDALAEAESQYSHGSAQRLLSGVSWVPFSDEEPFHGQIMQLDASPVPLGDDSAAAPGSIVGLGLFCRKDIQWSDRVEFSEDEFDEFGMPKPVIHYALTARDRATIHRARSVIRAWADAVGEPLDDDVIELPPGASLHYQGTMAMGEADDGRSVCSPNSEVWGTRGLFVGGNGVIPTATACNPTLTSVALAIRSARTIAKTLNTATSAARSDDHDSNQEAFA